MVCVCVCLHFSVFLSLSYVHTQTHTQTLTCLLGTVALEGSSPIQLRCNVCLLCVFVCVCVCVPCLSAFVLAQAMQSHILCHGDIC